ncbi:quaternary amine ABC transporter ATP-binding protein [Rhizobium oryzicola]|uniref:Quaternary amine transport ATP-binding protein n=1 Tax=Rhizobium oryzicola TaxID=1232668 RepID=A0ABT8SZZ9_9HYPH|nr:glycine betaine/L-proline ABC transporter ATP-binding protein [Rhizobium oryzicola]MDO1583222.1 glycine betaine/L-proline ABC transporter ATP-binding protein [Rhizobium oryzicola]
MSGLAIEIRHLYKLFGGKAGNLIALAESGLGRAEMLSAHNHVLALSDINLHIESGRIQVIMGLSGSGKSTLIRHINRLIDPTSGNVLVGGTDVTRLSVKELRQFRREATAMVFQKFALLPHRTVLDNVVYGLEIKGVARAEQERHARKWIDRVGLGGYERRLPSQLSGGMQQRVGLARALCNDAPILLMDEAFSALDPLIRVDMQSVLLDLQKEIRKTIVFITHDLDEALRLGDRIAILKDGLIVQNGTPEDIVLTPADDYVSAFVKEVNRGRVLTLSSVMRAGEPAQSPLGLTADLTLEEALSRMIAADASEAAVLSTDGVLLGRVRFTDIVAATLRTSVGTDAGLPVFAHTGCLRGSHTVSV